MGIPPVLTWDKGIRPSGRMGVPPIRKDVDTPYQEGWGCPLWRRKRIPTCQPDGVPSPPKCEQTHTCENSTFPHPWDAGGKNVIDIISKYHACMTCWRKVMTAETNKNMGIVGTILPICWAYWRYVHPVQGLQSSYNIWIRKVDTVLIPKAPLRIPL